MAKKAPVCYDKVIKFFMLLTQELGEERVTKKSKQVNEILKQLAGLFDAQPTTATRIIAMMRSPVGGSSAVKPPYLVLTKSGLQVIEIYQAKRKPEALLAKVSKTYGIPTMRKVEKLILEGRL